MDSLLPAQLHLALYPFGDFFILMFSWGPTLFLWMDESGAQNPQPRPRVEEHSFSGSGDEFSMHLPPSCGHGFAVHSSLSHTWRGHTGSLWAHLWVTPWSPWAATQWIKGSH